MSDPISYKNNATQEKPFPAELKKWNWGAFLLSWIWGLGNRTYVSLFSLLPLVNIVMPFVLGAKGNEWAWRNKHWDSIEHFKRVQRLWAIWGVIYLGVLVVLGGGIFFLSMEKLSDNQAIKMAVNSVSQNKMIIEKIGSPIKKKGWPSGQLHTVGPNGYMNGSMDVEGPQGTATIYVKAYLEHDEWNVVQLVVNVHKTGERIEIINYALNSYEMQKFERERQALSKD